jgi:hypothetical protein
VLAEAGAPTKAGALAEAEALPDETLVDFCDDGLASTRADLFFSAFCSFSFSFCFFFLLSLSFSSSFSLALLRSSFLVFFVFRFFLKMEKDN